MKNIAIFASGSGSNAERLTEYFAESKLVNVSLFLTNNKNAGVIERGFRLGIPTVVFSKSPFAKTDKIVALLVNQHIDYIVLAGFLWLIPENLLKAFPDKIINIHPALLPKYGGKGMWGHHVHDAVVANKETESGITIHLVNEEYDKGEILFQAKCEVSPTDSAVDIATKIQKLEHEHLPPVIEEYLLKL
ncbi:MAG: phosphoribosylglycinamide formyltransferase-1 [Spirosomataceae bacterium]